jgi:hypothetical protein
MKDQSAEKSAQQEDGIILYALVGPDSKAKNAKYNFRIGNWCVDDYRSSLIRFRYTLPSDFKETDVYEAVSNLENILLSMFVNDYIPRRILYFEHERIEKEKALQLMEIFGQCGDPFGNEKTNAINCFAQRGMNLRLEDFHLDALPSPDSIEEWFRLFTNMPSVAASVGLIQEAFAISNQFEGTYRYHNILEVSKAIIFMTSGLESLFFKNSQDKADISFKFRLIGAIFYEKYVKEAFLSQFLLKPKKFSFADFKSFLRAIYDFRSSIVHGKASEILKRPTELKKWKKIFEIMHISPSEPTGRSGFLRNIMCVMTCLQPHLLALIVCSKWELKKGADIVDEIFASEKPKTPGAA